MTCTGPSRNARDPAAQTVLAMIERAAQAGEPCPSNGEIMDAVGAKSVSSGARVLERLERRGLIAIERGANARVVTILATGKRTDGEIGVQHWSRRGVVKSAAKPEPRILPTPVHRDPCPYCGTRGDIGCRHPVFATRAYDFSIVGGSLG